MNKKLISVTILFMSQIFAIILRENPKQMAISKFQSESECVSNILSFMSFRFNYKCVQFVRGNGKHSIGCIASIIQHSHDITIFMRSMSWFLNRNILSDESLWNANKRNSTKSCENFLFFVDNTATIKFISAAAAVRSNTTQILFPFSKLYFMFEERNYVLEKSEVKELSKFFSQEAHFGYIFEFNSDNGQIGLRDLLTNQYTVQYSWTNKSFIHPFVDRRNRKKHFRVRFNNCYPYVIIENTTQQR